MMRNIIVLVVIVVFTGKMFARKDSVFVDKETFSLQSEVDLSQYSDSINFWLSEVFTNSNSNYLKNKYRIVWEIQNSLVQVKEVKIYSESDKARLLEKKISDIVNSAPIEESFIVSKGEVIRVFRNQEISSIERVIKIHDRKVMSDSTYINLRSGRYSYSRENLSVIKTQIENEISSKADWQQINNLKKGECYLRIMLVFKGDAIVEITLVDELKETAFELILPIIQSMTDWQEVYFRGKAVEEKFQMNVRINKRNKTITSDLILLSFT
jgi:hypothetical protein